VHQHIDRAPLLGHPGEHRLDLGRILHVERLEQGGRQRLKDSTHPARNSINKALLETSQTGNQRLAQRQGGTFHAMKQAPSQDSCNDGTQQKHRKWFAEIEELTQHLLNWPA